MKRWMAMLVALALCVSLLCVPALAAQYVSCLLYTSNIMVGKDCQGIMEKWKEMEYIDGHLVYLWREIYLKATQKVKKWCATHFQR